MERDDLDRLLSDDEIVPSSGFVACVMEAVRVEAVAPPAIPFPWSRALPGIVATAVALIATVAGFFMPGSDATEGTLPTLASVFGSSTELTWMLVVVLLSTVPVVLSLRIMRGRS